jgi:hypothetical protein
VLLLGFFGALVYINAFWHSHSKFYDLLTGTVVGGLPEMPQGASSNKLFEVMHYDHDKLNDEAKSRSRARGERSFTIRQTSLTMTTPPIGKSDILILKNFKTPIFAIHPSTYSEYFISYGNEHATFYIHFVISIGMLRHEKTVTSPRSLSRSDSLGNTLSSVKTMTLPPPISHVPDFGRSMSLPGTLLLLAS